MELLCNIARDQNVIKLTQERILSKMEMHEINCLSGSRNISEPTIYLDQNFCDLFPMRDSVMFLEVENLIINDKSFVDKLVRTFLTLNIVPIKFSLYNFIFLICFVGVFYKKHWRM